MKKGEILKDIKGISSQIAHLKNLITNLEKYVDYKMVGYDTISEDIDHCMEDLIDISINLSFNLGRFCSMRKEKTKKRNDIID